MRALRLAAVVLVAIQVQAVAAEPDDWRGLRVMPKLEASITLDGGKTDYYDGPWTVLAAEGEWLLLAGPRNPRVLRSQVVTFAEAPAYYTELINKNQRTAWAYTCRAIALTEKGDLDLAIADYGESLRLNPRPHTYVNRGSTHLHKKDYDKAISDFNEALRIDPSLTLAYCLRGKAWLANHDSDKAIKDYTQAVRLDPSIGMAWYARGLAWLEKKEYEQAITDYDQAIRLMPTFTWPYYHRGIAWKKMKQFDKALADFAESIRLQPGNWEALNSSAWLLATCPEERFRRGNEAVDAARKACELTDWKEPACIDTLGAAYAESGDFDSAIKYQNQVIELNPKSKTAKERLELYKEHQPYRDK